MSVVIPVANPAGLPLILRGLPPVDEVIVVTGRETVAAVRAGFPDALVVHPARSGPGHALACGIAAGRGDIVVTLNSDGSTDPAEIPRFVDALVAGADVVLGSRYRAGGRDLTGGRFRRWADRLLIWVVNALFGTHRTDPGFGYAAFWRDAVPRLDLPDPSERAGAAWGEGPEIRPLLAVRPESRGLSVTEIGSVAYPRLRRTARADRAGLRHWLLALAGEYSSRPRRRARHAAATPPLPAPRAVPGSGTSRVDPGAAASSRAAFTRAPGERTADVSPGARRSRAAGAGRSDAPGASRSDAPGAGRSDAAGAGRTNAAGASRSRAARAGRSRAADAGGPTVEAPTWAETNQRPEGEPIWGPPSRRPSPGRDLWRTSATAEPNRPESNAEPNRPESNIAPWTGGNGRPPAWPGGHHPGGSDAQPRPSDDDLSEPAHGLPEQNREVGSRRRRLQSFRQPRPDLRVINGEGTGTPRGRGSGRLRAVPRKPR